MWSVNAPTAYSGVVQWEVGSHSYFYPIMPNKCTIRIMADLILSKQTMSSLEIAELTGKQHAHVMRDIRNLLEQGVSESNFGLSSYNQPQPNGGYKKVDCYELTRKGSLILASGYNALLREKIIDRWEALETGKAEPIITSVKTEVKQPTISDKMKAATWAAKFLNLNESSKLIIAKQILEPYNLPLPDYTPSKGVLKSASKLLAEMGLKKQISAQVFNKRAIEKGYLYDIERDSSHGQKKQFKSITEKGLSYGENQVSPNNPRETQPLWYVDKFSELLGILGFQFMGGLPYEN
jgi:hypothetical protein